MESISQINELKSGDIVKFISKDDGNNVINGEILKIDSHENRIYFINTNYPNVGTQNMTEYSICKYWDIVKVG